MAGILYELMELLTHRRTREALASPELLLVLATVSETTRERWDSLIADAPTHAPNSNRSQSLFHQLRNCVAFHYDQVSLARSFLEFFNERARVAPTEHNRRAMYSYGPDMDGTRYYYADAAANELFLGLATGRSEDRSDRRLVDVAVQVNEALAPMIHAFICHRDAAP